MFEGELETNGTFNVNKTFPNAKNITINGIISENDKELLSECSKIEVLMVDISNFGLPDLQAKVVIDKNINLQKVILFRTMNLGTLQSLSNITKLTHIDLGQIAENLLIADPAENQMAKFKSLEYFKMTVAADDELEYRPAFKFEKVENFHLTVLDLVSNKWEYGIFKKVVEHHAKGFRTVITYPTDFQHLHDIIQFTVDVKEIAFPYFDFPFAFEEQLENDFVQMFEKCPKDTNIKKFIMIGVPRNIRKLLRKTADTFLNMPKANWNWGVNVGNVNSGSDIADVTFERVAID